MLHGKFLAGRAILVLGIIPALQVPAQELGKSTVSPRIPFELVSDFLVVVRGQIGDLDGLKFIVDTGATRSVIDSKVADRLRLPRRAGKVMNFDRDISVEWADIPDLRVGSLRSEAIRVTVMKLGEYSEFAKNVDGIIGLDLLSRSKKLTIDYEGRTLSFQLPDGGAADPVFASCFTIPFVVQGITVRLVVDTGHQDVLLYGNRVRRRLPKIHTQGESKEVTLGRIHATRVKLPDVRIGGPNEVTTVFMIDGPDELALPGVDGYLGVLSLHAKHIEFDFAARVLRWQ
jgi:predicted aspartyl protease